LAVQYGDVSSMTRSCFTLLASTTIGSGRGVIFGKRRLGDAQLSGTDFVRVLVPARRAAVVSMVRGSLPCRRKNPRFTPRQSESGSHRPQIRSSQTEAMVFDAPPRHFRPGCDPAGYGGRTAVWIAARAFGMVRINAGLHSSTWHVMPGWRDRVGLQS